MASCKLDWILCVLALVGCLLINTVASNDDGSDVGESETVVSKLKAAQTIKEVDDILHQNYGNKKQIDVLGHSLEELADMCTKSEDRCSRRRFEAISSLGQEYEKTIPLLDEYAEHCYQTTLKDYCVEEIEKVAEHMLQSVDQYGKKLVVALLDNLKKANVEDMTESKHILKAYEQVRESEFNGEGLDLDSEKVFLKKIENTLYDLTEKSRFISEVLGIKQEDFPESLKDIMIEDLDPIDYNFSYCVSVSVATGKIQLGCYTDDGKIPKEDKEDKKKEEEEDEEEYPWDE